MKTSSQDSNPRTHDPAYQSLNFVFTKILTALCIWIHLRWADDDNVSFHYSWLKGTNLS